MTCVLGICSSCAYLSFISGTFSILFAPDLKDRILRLFHRRDIRIQRDPLVDQLVHHLGDLRRRKANGFQLFIVAEYFLRGSVEDLLAVVHDYKT